MSDKTTTSGSPASAVTVHTIVTHAKPQLSDIIAIWLLQRFGATQFPGVSSASVVYTGTGGNQFCGMDGNAMLQQGFIAVGIGGGAFDEHARNGHGRVRGECEATLVATKLGLRRKPWFERVCDEVAQSDLEGKDSFFSLAGCIKMMHRQNSSNPQDVIDRVFEILDALYEAREVRFGATWRDLPAFVSSWAVLAEIGMEEQRQKAFARFLSTAGQHNGETNPPLLRLDTIANCLIVTNKYISLVYDIFTDVYEDMKEFVRGEVEFSRSARRARFEGPQGVIKVAFVPTESRHVQKLGFKDGADVVVAFRGDGHCQIFTKKRFTRDGSGRQSEQVIDLRDLVRLLRIEEMQLSGAAMPKTPEEWKKLWFAAESVEGHLTGAGAWYYFPKGAMILNGSTSHEAVPATKIAPERIERLVELAFTGEFFPTFARSHCLKGRCAGEECPFITAGLLRCREVRAPRS